MMGLRCSRSVGTTRGITTIGLKWGSGISDMYPGTYYGDIADSRLYVWLADGSDPNSHVIEYANRARAFYQPGTPDGDVYSYANYVDFDGLNLRHDNVYDNTGQDTGCAIYTEGDQRLIDCDIEYNGGVGVFSSRRLADAGLREQS